MDTNNEVSFINKHFTKPKKLPFKLLTFRPKDNGCLPPLYSIMIRPTDFCNFSCDYCFSYTKNKHNVLSRENIEHLNRVTKDIQNKHYYIHGGEPFSYKDLFYLFDEISKPEINNVPPRILVQTNLKLLKLEDIEKLLKYPNIKLNISVHQNINLNEYIEKFRMLNKYNLIDNIEIMYTKHNKKNRFVYEALYKEFPSVEIYYIFNEYDDNINRVDQEKEYLIEYKEYNVEPNFTKTKFISFSQFFEMGINFNFKGFECNSGSTGFILNYDGNIYRCQADLFIKQKPFTTISEFKEIETNICQNDCCICDLQYTRKLPNE